ncbi:Uncharacterised protein [Fluoribacter dumoffii]|uniref:Uncharacterized protein n=1 Tax=Fluoribacter dumoffii TaxID=463 RepID=A0A377IVI7_9GAMM|nr:Uncharacterised protein [Fluoribacter dumoffii]
MNTVSAQLKNGNYLLISAELSTISYLQNK